jgi:hypothetical protein
LAVVLGHQGIGETVSEAVLLLFFMSALLLQVTSVRGM